ncbi:MAG: alpha/beta hydrolase [Verrucomicrobiales bacterium]|nr:alpha/beta hydrolase [Verrucomicrobiales bacterium]
MPIISSDDGILSYELHGEGQGHSIPVVWIQGVGVCGDGWRPQVERMGSPYAHLVFDNRGLGRSQPCRGEVSIPAMAEDVRRLMDAVGWESAHVVGHSMGGIISQEFALRFRTRVRSLSLLCTFPRGRDAARPTPWVIWMTLRTRLGTRSMRRRAFLEMILPPKDLEAGNTDLLALELSRYVGRDLADQPSILLRQVRALAKHDTSHQLQELGGIPTLVVSAELDPIAPPRYGRSLAQKIPGSRYEELPDVSHAVTLHRPEMVHASLTRFLENSEVAWAAKP